MSTFWSPTAPGKQKPGGASWFAELISAFGLDLTLAMSMGVTSKSMAQFGLSVSPEVAMAALGVSSGEFALAFSPALGMVIPVPIAASLELPLSPGIRMHAAEQYARSLGLILPTKIAAAGASKSTAKLGLSLTPGFAMTGVGVTATPVAFNVLGGGAAATTSMTGNSFTATWTHSASGSDRAVLVGFDVNLLAGLSTATVAVTYGGVAMTQLGIKGLNNSTTTSGFSAVYGLLNPPTGTQTVKIVITQTGLTFLGGAVNSFSYTGVGSFGTPVTNSGSGTAPAVIVPGGVSDMEFALLATGAASIASFNQTSRYAAAASTAGVTVVMGDAPGAASATFSAITPTATWSAIGIPLLHA